MHLKKWQKGKDLNLCEEMTPEETCNLPNLLSGSSTGTGARTETGELGGKRTHNSLFFTMWTFKQWEAASSPWNGEIVLLPGFLGHCCSSYLFFVTWSSSTSPLLPQIHLWSDSSSRRGWLPSYLMSFSVSLMPTLNPNPIERNSSVPSVRYVFYPSKFGAFYVYFQPVSPARTAWF